MNGVSTSVSRRVQLVLSVGAHAGQTYAHLLSIGVLVRIQVICVKYNRVLTRSLYVYDHMFVDTHSCS